MVSDHSMDSDGVCRLQSGRSLVSSSVGSFYYDKMDLSFNSPPEVLLTHCQ